MVDPKLWCMYAKFEKVWNVAMNLWNCFSREFLPYVDNDFWGGNFLGIFLAGRICIAIIDLQVATGRLGSVGTF